MKLRCNSCDRISKDLYIQFTRTCFNTCPFCFKYKDNLSPHQFEDFPINKKVKIMINKVFEENPENIFVTGGEPLLEYDDLRFFIKELKSYTDAGIYIITSLPTAHISYPQFEELLTLVDGVNISYHSGWKRRNAEIHKKSIIGYYNEELRRKYIYKANAWHKKKIRIDLNLNTLGITSVGDLRYALNTFAELGCYHVRLNELQNSSNHYVSFEDLTEETLPSPYAHGCETILYYLGLTHFTNFEGFPIYPAQYHTFNFPDWLEGIKLPDLITLKRSCFLVEPSREANFSDLSKLILRKVLPLSKEKFRVMYEDGSIYDYWLKNEKE